MLSIQQSELLKAIFLNGRNVDSSTQQQVDGLVIYQRSLLANASKAMAITFATVHSLLGEIKFTQLVQKYLFKELKTDYDWGEFGVNFSEFIKHQVMLNSALLSDLAALDYLCHQSERSKDKKQDLASLHLLGAHDAYQLKMILNSGTFVLSSSFPLDEIVSDMNELSEQQHASTLDDVEKRLAEHSVRNHNNQVFYFMVWRPNFQAQYSQIDQSEFDWFTGLIKSENLKQFSLGDVLDRHTHDEFSLVEWLPKAIQEQSINGVYRIPNSDNT